MFVEKNKKIDTLNLALMFSSFVMIVISLIVTILLYVEDGDTMFDKFIFGSMGAMTEFAKTLFLILTVWFIFKKNKIMSMLCSLLAVTLVIVSIIANIQYSTNADNQEIVKNKVETTEYLELLEQKKAVTSRLAKLTDDEKLYINKINEYEDNITKQNELMENSMSKYEKSWNKLEVSKPYKQEITRLQSEKDKLNIKLVETTKQVSDKETIIKNINKKLENTKRYDVQTKGLNGKNIRIFLGILFEIIAVMLFFVGLIRKNIIQKENVTIQDNIPVHTSTDNEIVVNREIEKKQNDKNQYSIPVHTSTDNEININLDIENNKVKEYFSYVLKNSDDGIAIGQNKVAESIGISHNEARKIYKFLLENNFLKKLDRNKTKIADDDLYKLYKILKKESV